MRDCQSCRPAAGWAAAKRARPLQIDRSPDTRAGRDSGHCLGLCTPGTWTPTSPPSGHILGYREKCSSFTRSMMSCGSSVGFFLHFSSRAVFCSWLLKDSAKCSTSLSTSASQGNSSITHLASGLGCVILQTPMCSITLWGAWKRQIVVGTGVLAWAALHPIIWLPRTDGVSWYLLQNTFLGELRFRETNFLFSLSS